MKSILFLIFNLLFIHNAEAYPHFVGFGYTSCATCHYNPFGSGPLNDYGRALSATAVSAKWFYYQNESEEKIANNSGFFGSKPNQTWFRPSFDYRGMLLKRTLGEDNEDTEMIHMQPTQIWFSSSVKVINFLFRERLDMHLNLNLSPNLIRKLISTVHENIMWAIVLLRV